MSDNNMKSAAPSDAPQEQPKPVEPNNEEVICPACAHQFRAIPVQVQQLLLALGVEPPFLAAPVTVQPAKPEVVELANALQRLEDANDALCSLRTQEQYLWMINNGQQDALVELDNARSAARKVLTRCATSKEASEVAQEPEGEAAPPNNLPTWSECQLRVENSQFIAKRQEEGGYGADADSKTATELHRFIYEYDDADPYRSAWFLHRLELVLKEAAAQSVQPCRDAVRESVARAICAECGENPDHIGDAGGNEFRWQDYGPAADAAIRALRTQTAPNHFRDAAKMVQAMINHLAKRGDEVWHSFKNGIGPERGNAYHEGLAEGLHQSAEALQKMLDDVAAHQPQDCSSNRTVSAYSASNDAASVPAQAVTLTDEVSALMKFYSVDTIQSLALEQDKHITKLQEKLRNALTGQAVFTKVREG